MYIPIKDFSRASRGLFLGLALPAALICLCALQCADAVEVVAYYQGQPVEILGRTDDGRIRIILPGTTQDQGLNEGNTRIVPASDITIEPVSNPTPGQPAPPPAEQPTGGGWDLPSLPGKLFRWGGGVIGGFFMLLLNPTELGDSEYHPDPGDRIIGADDPGDPANNDWGPTMDDE